MVTARLRRLERRRSPEIFLKQGAPGGQRSPENPAADPTLHGSAWILLRTRQGHLW